MRTEKILTLTFSLVALVLEILPYGAVCNFANPEGEPWRQVYSYFSLTPFGYANSGPFITGILTVVIAFFALASLLFKGRISPKALSCICGCAVATSLFPLLLGVSFYSVTGGFITACLVGALVCSSLAAKEIRI